MLFPMMTPVSSGVNPPVTAPTPLVPDFLLSQGVVAYDLTEDWPLYQKDKDTRLDPASVIKILTALVVLQNKSGVLQSETVTVTASEAATPGSTAGLQEDDVLTIHNLLFAMAIPSGNDAAEALARHVGDSLSGGGGRARFITEMLAVANTAGVTGATIEDVGGGNGPGTNSLSTDEVRRIVQLADQEPLLAPYFSEFEVSLPVTGVNARTLNLSFTHKRVEDENFIFGKTGTTSTSDGSLATVITAPNGNKIALVHLHANESGGFSNRRYYDMTSLQYMLLSDFPYLQPVAAGDIHYSNVAALIGGDSLPIADESDNAVSLTNTGVTLSTSNKIVDVSAMDFSTGVLESTDASLHMGDSDFTIEFFLRGTGVEPTTGYLVSRYNTSGNQREFGVQYNASANEFRLWVSNDGDDRFNAAQGVDPSTFFNGAPRHIMAQRHGDNWSVWINGQRGLLNEVDDDYGPLHASTEPFRVGSTEWDGILDEVRVTIGTARAPKSSHPNTIAITSQKLPRVSATLTNVSGLKIGQSNGEASQTIGETVPTPLQFSDALSRIWISGTQSFETYNTAVNSNEWRSGIITPQRWGGEAEFYRRFRLANPTTQLNLVKICVSGSSLETLAAVDDWNPDNSGELFDATETQLNAANAHIVAQYGGAAPPLSFVIIAQGEDDAEDVVRASAYYQNLLDFETAIRTRLGDANTLIIIMRIAPSSVKPYASTVRAAQNRFVKDSSGPCVLVDIDSMDMHVDTYHLAVNGTTQFGSACFDAYSGAYPVVPVRFSPMASDKSGNLNLSNSNLTVEGTGSSSTGHQSLRCDTLIHYSDLSYFEIECTNVTGNMVIGMGARPSLTSYWGSIADSVGYTRSGNVYVDGNVVDTYDSYTTGDIICVAHNGTSGDVWFGKKSPGNPVVWNGDPTTPGSNPAATLSAKDPSSMWRYGMTCRRAGDIGTIQLTPQATVPTGYTHFV